MNCRMEEAHPRLTKASTNAQSLDRNLTVRSIKTPVARLQARSNSPRSRQSRLRNSTLVLCCLGIITGWLMARAISEDRATKTKQLVDAAYSIVLHFSQEEKAGRLDRQAAQTAAKAAIRAMRYDDLEYFWINDMHPRMIMHPGKPELDGTDLSDFADPTGKRLFLAFVETVQRDGAGFVNYLWPKLGLVDKPDPASDRRELHEAEEA